jgi:hypothetical protein
VGATGVQGRMRECRGRIAGMVNGDEAVLTWQWVQPIWNSSV